MTTRQINWTWYSIIVVTLLYVLAPALHLVVLSVIVLSIFAALDDADKDDNFAFGFFGLMFFAIGIIFSFMMAIEYSFEIGESGSPAQTVNEFNKNISDILVYIFRWKLIF